MSIVRSSQWTNTKEVLPPLATAVLLVGLMGRRPHMKNTMCPSPSTTAATTALALSLLQAPALPAAEGADHLSSPSASSLSHVENALIHGTARDAFKIIEGSGLKDVRPEVVEKEMASVVEKVVKDVMLQGKVEDAQRVARTVREVYPDAARVGILRAFATLDTESFEKFCNQSVMSGQKPHLGFMDELNKSANQLDLPPSKSAELVEVMGRVDSSRTIARLGVDAAALGAVGIAAVSGASRNRSALSHIVQTVGGAAATIAGALVFSSSLGESVSLFSLNNVALALSLGAVALGLEQMTKGIGLSNKD
jgi:hypothetical protein